MEFSKEIKELFKEAGWQSGRNVRNAYVLPYKDYPPFVIDFLNEYANLRVKGLPHESLSVVPEVIIDSDAGAGNLEEDKVYPYYSGLIKRKLFPLGYILPDGYHICCDADGRVYQISEYCFYVGKGIKEGITNILVMNTLQSLQLDEDTGNWWNIQGVYVPLP